MSNINYCWTSALPGSALSNKNVFRGYVEKITDHNFHVANWLIDEGVEGDG